MLANMGLVRLQGNQVVPLCDLYGLVIVFWHESEQIELYQALQNRVALRATRIQVRA
jgi:hypothetical protein